MRKVVAWGLAPAFFTLGNVVASPLTYDFESGLDPGFDRGVRYETSGYSSYGFGDYFLWDNLRITHDLTGLEKHSSIDLEFDLAVIDSWDGRTMDGGTTSEDFFDVFIDGVSVFHASFDNFQETDGLHPPGKIGPNLVFGSYLFHASKVGIKTTDPHADSAYSISLRGIKHSASSLTITWEASGAGWQGIYYASELGEDESFAVDNIKINTVPEPATMFLLATAWVGLASFGKRKGGILHKS